MAGLLPVLALAAALGLAAGPLRADEVRAVSLDGLHGTLLMPAGEGRVPAALVIAGSGPTDRDGNGPGLRNDSLKLLAEGLAARGIATLRTDKRGIGESRLAGPKEADLRFSTYVEDAVGWLKQLAAEPRVDRVFLIGHSEGALVATLVAERHAVSGLVLVAGAGEPAWELIARQLAAAGVPDTLRQESARIVASLVAGQAVAEVSPALAPLYRPTVQPYMMSWLPLDPASELAKVSAPVMVVQGTHDLQIGTGDAERLKAARPDAERLLIDGMNHVLRDAPAERAGNMALYAQPEVPLSAPLVPAIATFLLRH